MTNMEIEAKSDFPDDVKKQVKCNVECIGNLNSAHEECNPLKEMLPPSVVSECHVCSFNPSKLGFKSCFRLRLETVEEVKKFLATFQEKSYVTWRLQSTNPAQMSAGNKNLFWARYRCQSSNDRIDKNATRPHAKHSGCNANMVITLKRRPSNRKSRSKDPHMPDFPTIITVCHEHNHELYCMDALKFRDVSKETSEKFKKLFQSGHSPASALNMHKFDLQWEYADVFVQTLADRFICPDYQWTHRLYRKIFSKEYGLPKEAVLDNLETKILEINSSSDKPLIKMEQVLSQTMIAICTPLMRRVHTLLPQSGDIAFLEASGAMERHNHRIFFILTHSCAGGLPLGVIITTSESETVITHGLEMIKSLVGNEGFYNRGKKGPKVFMSDDSSVLQNALADCFRDSVILLSVYNILNTSWQWLWDAKHKIPLSDRTPLMYFLRYLMHAWNEEELNNCYNAVLRDPVALKHANYLEYLSRLWERRQQWALVLHLDPTNNIAGTVIKVMKDTLLHKLKYYNIIQLVDFIFTRMDLYYQRRISDVLAGNYLSAMRHRYMPADNSQEEFNIKRLSEDLFEVGNDDSSSFQVNITIGRCSCRVGQSGAPCRHHYAVVKNYDIASFCFLPVYDTSTRDLLLQVCGNQTADPAYDVIDCNDTDNHDPISDAVQDHESFSEMQEAPSVVKPTPDPPQELYVAECDALPYDSGVFSDTESDSVQVECLKELEKFYCYVRDKVKEQPSIFLPAVTKFVDNFSHLQNDQERVLALSSFAVDPLCHDKRSLEVCESDLVLGAKKKR